MNRITKEFLRGLRPQLFRAAVQDSLQIAQLMRKAELKDFSRRFQLRSVTVADPDLNRQLAHHFDDLGGRACRRDRVINAVLADEDPLPPVFRLDPRAGFVRANDLAGNDLFFDGLGKWLRLLSGALDDRGDRALAQIDAVQIAHRLDASLNAQMLRLFVEDHGRFQVRPKASLGFQTFRQDCSVECQAMWASRMMPPRFNDDGLGRGQLRNLPAERRSNRPDNARIPWPEVESLDLDCLRADGKTSDDRRADHVSCVFSSVAG